jgi:hypothetical protein
MAVKMLKIHLFSSMKIGAMSEQYIPADYGDARREAILLFEH